MEGSIEERQHTMLQQKIAIANAVVDGEGIDDKGGVALTAGSLKAFLQNITVQTYSMPNAPKTPTRTIRVASDLWAAVKDKAAIEGRTVTDVIVEALKKYIAE